MRAPRRRSLVLAALLLAAVLAAGGRAPAAAPARGATGVAVGPHVALTAPRPARPGDAARAAAVAAALRRSTARYRDVRAAERAGYRIFAPEVPQAVHHFTHLGKAVRERFRFDPADPSSLLYRRTPAGGFELVGAMVTAPPDASPEALDARVPLSAARSNVCVPRELLSRARWKATRGGRPLFGADGVLATRRACEEAGGRFHAQLFGWMVHAAFDARGGAAWQVPYDGEREGGHGGAMGTAGPGR